MVTEQERTSGAHRRRVPPWAGWVGPVAGAAAPWAWFAVRDLTPALDALAYAMPVVAALAAVATFGYAMVSLRMRNAIVSVSLLVFAVVVVVGPRLPQRTPVPLRPFRLVSANTFLGNPQPGNAARALAAARPDVLVTVETRSSLATDLRATFPTDAIARVGQLDVVSRWPIRRMPKIPTVRETTGIRVLIERPGNPFVLYAIHLANPLHAVSFAAHAGTVRRLLGAAESERLPVVLAGDFNTSDRTTSYRDLDTAMTDAMRSRFAGSSYEDGLWLLLQLRIDHVFVSRTLCAADGSTFNLPGSDHEGLSVDIGRCP